MIAVIFQEKITLEALLVVVHFEMYRYPSGRKLYAESLVILIERAYNYWLLISSESLGNRRGCNYVRR